MPSFGALEHGDVEACATADEDIEGSSAAVVLEFVNHSEGIATHEGNKLMVEVDKLKAENVQLRSEIEITMRKADRRFEQELVTRRAWNRDRESLEARIEELQRCNMLLTAELDSRNRLQETLRVMLRAVSDALPMFRGGVSLDAQRDATQSPASHFASRWREADCFRGTQSSSSDCSSGEVNAMKPFFCVVCLEATASVALHPCGHVCYCSTHAQEIKQRNQLRCPLCQAMVTSFLAIQGIDCFLTMIRN